MRNRKKLPPAETAPYQWTPPGGASFLQWGTGAGEADDDAEGAGADIGEVPAEAVGAALGVAGEEPILWAELFGNAHPVEIEVGFGKGLFLVTTATAHPDRNYFGIEIIRKYQLYATNRLAAHDLRNARTCCADAKRILERHVSPGSVEAVHVYFPDPWWKNRHKKRLLMTEEFVRLVHRVLVPGGVFHFATDVPDYFAWVRETMANVPELAPIGPPEEPPPAHDMDYLTNFERRFRKLGKPIHRERYRKPAPTA